VWKGAGNGA